MAAHDRPERRRFNRTLMLRTGTIMVADDRPDQNAMTCAVLDLSSNGACLLVPKDAIVPPSFALVMDSSGEKLDCAVKWQDGCRVGVEARRRAGGDTLDRLEFRLRLRAPAVQTRWRYAVGRGLIEAAAVDRPAAT